MGRLNLLELSTDITRNQGRGLLFETLERFSNAIKRARDEISLVRQQDRVVRPVPIEAYPFSSGLPSAIPLKVGTIAAIGSSSAPPDWVECNGQSLSTSTYSTLFNQIGYTFGGSGSTFNVPDLRGRVPLGKGTGGGLTSRLLGAGYGGETIALTQSNLPNVSFPVTDAGHTHAGPSHNHTIAHTHTFGHNHDLLDTGTGAGTAKRVTPALVGAATASGTVYTTSQTSNTTGAPSTSVSGNSGTGNTGSGTTGISVASGGSGSSLGILQPSLGVMWIIRSSGDPTDQALEAPVSWGPVTGSWNALTPSTMPAAALVNDLDTDAGRSLGVVKLTSSSGGGGGNSTNHEVTGIVRVPYNFRAWRTRGVNIQSKINLTGVATSSTCVVTLSVEDPVNPGTSVATHTRVISESGGSISDSVYVESKITAQDLGPDWQPGYPLKFTLNFAHPLTYSTLDVRIGALEANWR